MWKCLVLSLFLQLVSTTGTLEQCLTEVVGPKDLTVGHNSDTEVTLFWYFPDVGNLSDHGLEFILLLQTEEEAPRKYHTGPIPKPFHYKLRKLFPSTRYHVKLWATQPGCVANDLQIANYVFNTMDTDWPTPVILSVTKGRNKLFSHFVEWKLVPIWKSLKYFLIEMCTKGCVMYKRGREIFDAEIRLAPHLMPSFRVAAVYSEPGIWEVVRYSDYFLDWKTFSPWAIFTRNSTGQQLGNQVVLDWHEMFALGEPSTYFDIYVRDPKTVTDGFNAGVPNPRASLFDRDEYVLNFDDEKDVTIADAVEDRYKPATIHQCTKPRDALRLRVVKRTISHVHFRIYFPEPRETDSEEIDVVRKRSQLRLGPCLSDAFGLTPYEMLEVKVRNCIDFKFEGPDICGNFSHFKVLSNVAGPSAVQFAELMTIDKTAAAIIWDTPETRNGPIDGYKVRIQNNQSEITLESMARFYVIENFDHSSPYEIAVAAFNLDLEYDGIELVGDWRTVLYHGEPGLFMISVLSLGYLSLGWAAFLLTYMLIRQPGQRNYAEDVAEDDDRGEALVEFVRHGDHATRAGLAQSAVNEERLI